VGEAAKGEAVAVAATVETVSDYDSDSGCPQEKVVASDIVTIREGAIDLVWEFTATAAKEKSQFKVYLEL